MADEPISALTLIAAPTGTPPYPTAFTDPRTGAMLEILDTTNTSMASTGTNSRIPPGHLLMGFLNPGSNVTLSETSGIVTIAASGGVTSTYFSNIMTGGPYSTSSVTYVNCTNANLTIHTPGTYMLFATVSAQVNWVSTAVLQENVCYIQIYDSNASAAVPGTIGILANGSVSQVSGITLFGPATSGTFGPYIVSPSASDTFQLQFCLGGDVGAPTPQVFILACTMTAVRIA